MKSITKLKDDARRHEQREEWEKAIRAYQQVLAAQEEGESELELSLYNRIGDLFVRLNRARDAVKYYEQAADRYAVAGLFNNAIALCNKALRYRSDRPELLRKLGQFSASQGFLTDARRYLLEYAEKQFVSGDVSAALSALEEFAEVAGDAEVRELLGRRLHTQGRVAEAVTQLKRALELRTSAGQTEAAEALRREITLIDADALRGRSAREAAPPAPPLVHSAPPRAPASGTLRPGPGPRVAGPVAREQAPRPDRVPERVRGDAGALPGAAAPPGATPPAGVAPPPGAGAPPERPAAPSRPPSPLDARASAIDPSSVVDVNLTGGVGPDAESLDLSLMMDIPGPPGAADEAGQPERPIARVAPIDGLETTEFEGAVAEPLDGLLADLASMEGDTQPAASVEVPGLERPEEPETVSGSAFAPGEEFQTGSAIEPPSAMESLRMDARTEDVAPEPAGAFELPPLTWPEADTLFESHSAEPGADTIEGAEDSGWETTGEAADEPLDLPLLRFEEQDTAAPATPDDERRGGEEPGEAEDQGFELPLLGDLEDSEPLPLAATPPTGGLPEDGDTSAPYAGDLPDIEEPPELEGPDRSPAASDRPAWLDVDDARNRADTTPQDASSDDMFDRDPWATPPVAPAFRAPPSGLDIQGRDREESGPLPDRGDANPPAAEDRPVSDWGEPTPQPAPPGDGPDLKSRAPWPREVPGEPEELPADIVTSRTSGRTAPEPVIEEQKAALYGDMPEREPIVEPKPIEAMKAPPRAEPTIEPEPTTQARDEAGEEYVDLAALIVDTPADDDTRFVVQEKAPTGDEDRDFAELLSQFKEKVSEHVSVEDAAAHYDLGLAFKEMGLIDEAIGEFQVALRAGDMRLKVYEELGNCFLQKQQYNIAEKVLRRALESPFDDELELLGVYYHLGRACEELGNRDGARDAYERVLGMDIHFADVAARLARL